MALKENLRKLKMHKGESVTAYLMRFQEVCHELAAIREKPIDTNLVCVAMNGFTKYWHTFFIVLLDEISC